MSFSKFRRRNNIHKTTQKFFAEICPACLRVNWYDVVGFMGPTTLVDSSRVPRRQLFKSGVEPMTEELREATYLRGKLHKVKDVAVGFLTCGPETLKVYGCPPMPQVDW